jgi:hypothetical protein
VLRRLFPESTMTTHVVALSGGADSTALALRLREIEPDTPFNFVCTPTGDELPEMFDHWRRLGDLLGSPLIPIMHQRGLNGEIRKQKCLPNNRIRYCTRVLKIEPYRKWLTERAALGPVVSYVGLRADEEGRAGGAYEDIDGVSMRFPLREWGWTRADVLSCLEQRGVSIPERTDCARCVSGDARVMVQDRGFVRLADLADGEEVTVWSGVDWRPTQRVSQGERDTVRLSLSSGLSVQLTADHKVLTKKRGMVPAAELLPGEPLVWQTPTAAGAFPQRASLPAGAIPLRSVHSQARNVVMFNAPTQWSREIGLLLGYILGDGSVSGSPHPTVSIGAARQDREDLVALRDIVRDWFDTRSEIVDYVSQPGPASAAVLAADHRSEMSSIRWRVLPFAQLLGGLGLDKASPIAERRAPASIWTASEAGVSGFLSGLFSTDGNVGKRDSWGAASVDISLSSVSRGLMADVQQLLLGFGIYSTICSHNDGREKRGYLELWRLAIAGIDHVRRFEERIGFFNARKAALLRTGVQGRVGTIGRERWPTVRAVEPAGKVEVFDLLNVGPERQFVADGISVSNCFHQRLGEWWMLWREHPGIYTDAEGQEAEFGQTFRNPSRDSWPTSLAGLRARFEAGHIPPNTRLQHDLFRHNGACRVCTL